PVEQPLASPVVSEPFEEFAPAPPADCDFEVWLDHMLLRGGRQQRQDFKRHMSKVLTPRQVNILRAVYGVGQPRVAIAVLARSLKEKVRVIRDQLKISEGKLRK